MATKNNKNMPTTTHIETLMLEAAERVKKELGTLAYNVDTGWLTVENWIKLSIPLEEQVMYIGMIAIKGGVSPRGINQFIQDIKEQREKQKESL